MKSSKSCERPYRKVSKFILLLTFGLLFDGIFAHDDHSQENNQNSNEEQEKPVVVRRIFDPHSSWLAFVKNSERTSNRHRVRNGNASRRSGILAPPSGSPGPQGPPGPPGPPGPAGAEITKDALISEFRNIVKEAAERRLQQALDSKCQECNSSLLNPDETSGPYVPPLFDVDKVSILPRVTNGVFARLSNTISIPKKSLVEINNFHVPIGNGAFQRGSGFNPQNGRYEAPRAGIYHFIINLHVWHKASVHAKKTSDLALNKGLETVQAFLCIDSLCKKNSALESIVTLTQLGKRHSLIINGHLELKKNQHVSLFVDNNSSFSLKIHNNSYYSIILIGM